MERSDEQGRVERGSRELRPLLPETDKGFSVLYLAKDLRKCEIRAVDGEIGSVDDLFFDDRTWKVRYVVVETGNWLVGKKVLLPREVVDKPDWQKNELRVKLTRDEIENSPGLESDPPLAHDARLIHYDNFTWASYPWGGFIGGVPIAPATGRSDETKEALRKAPRQPSNHLRSVREITDYRIEAEDGSIGHVEDFLFEGSDWSIAYLVIDTRNWLPGKKVVVPPSQFQEMDWARRTATVAMTREAVEKAPELEKSAPARAAGHRVLTFTG